MESQLKKQGTGNLWEMVVNLTVTGVVAYFSLSIPYDSTFDAI